MNKYPLYTLDFCGTSWANNRAVESFKIIKWSDRTSKSYEAESKHFYFDGSRRELEQCLIYDCPIHLREQLLEVVMRNIENTILFPALLQNFVTIADNAVKNSNNKKVSSKEVNVNHPIKTLADFRRLTADLPGDFTLTTKVVREIPEEKLKDSIYPYPYEYVDSAIYIGDIGYSDNDIFLEVYENSEDN